MSKILIEKLNDAYIKVHSDPDIQHELWEFFSFKVPDAWHSPLYRDRKWDGFIRLYNKRSKRLPAGLLRHVHIFAKERNHVIEGYQYLADNFALVDAQNLCSDLKIWSNGKLLEPHEHQLLGITKSLRYKRCILESATNSGKSYIIYAICRYLQQKNLRGLIIVPNVGLVEQLYNDFKEYSTVNKWDADGLVNKIYSGQEKYTGKPIVISTWQSVYDLDDEMWFKQFDYVIGDEAHHFQSKSLIKIMGQLVNAKYRIGTTGSVQDGNIPRLTLEGYFGPIVKIATNKEMIEKGISSDLTIKCLVLKYPEKECRLVIPTDYYEELEFLVQHQKRNNFIKNLALSLKGNTLILFQLVEKHGKLLYNLLKDSGRPIYFIYGYTDVEIRESYRKIIEKETNAIIIASYGVYQEGVSIRNIHSIIFASPSKSKIRVLQSIGRGLRVSETKSEAILFDIADDLRTGGDTNYTLLHYVERMKLYQREQFKVKVYNINLGG